MKLLSWCYLPSDKHYVGINSNDLDYYTRHGYAIIKESSDGRSYIVSKNAEVIFEVIDDNGNYKEVYPKELIISLYPGSNISAKKAKRFFDEVQQGKWRLDFDRAGNLNAFPR